MALRLIEIQLPKSKQSEIKETILQFDNSSAWELIDTDEFVFIKLVLPAEETEKLMDTLEKRYGHDKHFKLILSSIEAVLPRLKEKSEEILQEDSKSQTKSVQRVSREELYHDIEDACRFNHSYIFMVILSAIVASIGLLKGNIPAIIGSMVIAPLLGPIVALSLAVTLGDMKLALKALMVNIWGIAIAFLLSASIGFIFKNFLMNNTEVLTINVDVTDIILALSAGAAGTLAFTTGLPAIIVGVMVAVALLPPLVSFGLLIGAGIYNLAWNAFVLVLVNIISINLAGVITFYLQGIRALTWWEEGKAQKMRSLAFFIWFFLLLILSGLIYFFEINITPDGAL